MRLFWKIFFGTMLISALCFVVGGSILIQSSFSQLLNREIEAAFQQNNIVIFALLGEVADKSRDLEHSKKEFEVYEKISRVAQSIIIQQSEAQLKFVLLERDGETLYSSFEKVSISDLLLEELSWTESQHVIFKSGERYIIQALTPASLFGKSFYVMTQRDVTALFAGENKQLQMLFLVVCGMLLAAGLMIYVLIKVVLRRIFQLTVAAEAISSGDLSQRVAVSGNDEVTRLSQNFNRMAEELQVKIGALKEVAENRERFVAAFAHEIKTPLTAIIGYADLLRGKPLSEKRTQMCAEYIFSEGMRLESLSMRLLRLMVVKQQPMNLQRVYMPTFFEEVKMMMMPQMMKSNILVEWTIESGDVRMDSDLMKAVFVNLIDNARKSLSDEGVINICGHREKGYYHVSIEDNGCGISQQDIDKIMEAFYMVDQSRTCKEGGVGLGLSICDEILKHHGFELSFHSVLGLGTKVTVKMKGGEFDKEGVSKG